MNKQVNTLQFCGQFSDLEVHVCHTNVSSIVDYDITLCGLVLKFLSAMYTQFPKLVLSLFERDGYI